MIEKNNNKKLKFKIFSVITIIMLLITIFRVISTIDLANKNRYKETKLIEYQIKTMFDKKLKNIEKRLLSEGRFIANEKSILNAFKNSNREELYKFSYKRYKKIQEFMPELSRMHFHTPDHKSFLRVHKPKTHGDNLKDIRPMIAKTIDTKKLNIGFEYGIHQIGTMPHFRITYPLFDKNIFIGVLEFGVDLSLMIDEIEDSIYEIFKENGKDHFKLSFIFYDNKFLNTKGLDKVGKFYLNKNDTFFYKVLKLSESKRKLDNLTLNDKEYTLKLDVSRVVDYLKKPLGMIVYAHDVTKYNQDFKDEIIFSIIKPVIILIIFLLLFDWIYRVLTKELSKTQKKIQGILDSQESIIVLAKDGKIVKTNISLFSFFGFENLNEFLAHYDCVCDRFEKGDNRYITKQMGEISWIEYMIKNPNIIHKVKIKDKDEIDTIFKVDFKNLSSHERVVTFTNITELERLNEDLAFQVQKKTKEIQEHNQQLEHRVKEEVDKNREKQQQLIHQSKLAQMGEMLSMIAHQWRQPLTAISATANNLSLKLMLDNIDKDEFEREIELIEGYSQHLSSTIDDFRGFFKENKSKELITLEEIVNSTLDISKVSIENKNITLNINLDCNKQIETYPSELKQVLLNLTKNAQDVLIEKQIKNPTISIETRCEKDSQSLIVKDNAGGVPKDIIEKIFEPYFSTKLEKDGTGLGLYMSKTIIEEHCGGRLTVSNDSEGAVFTIEFNPNISGGGDIDE